MTHPHPDPGADSVSNLGATLSGLASTPGDRDLLAAFAELVDVGTDRLGPLLLLVLIEPLAGAQIIPVGHACPGLAFRVNGHLDLRLVLDEPIEFYDHDTDSYSRTPPKASQPSAPQRVGPPSPPPHNVAALGTTLASLASSAHDRDCLQLFADELYQGTEAIDPLLLTVLIEPLAGAQIGMINFVRPGLTIRIDDDLQILSYLPD